MKKFIEDDFSVDCKTPLKAVQSIVVMLLTAPFKLVMTISSKILYLPKEAIVMSVRNSFLVSAVITVVIIVGKLYTHSFSLFVGKIPIVMLAVVTIFLAFLYVVVNATDFSAYSELSALLPQEKEELEEEQAEENQETPQVEQAGEEDGFIADDLSFGEDVAPSSTSKSQVKSVSPSSRAPQASAQEFSVSIEDNFKFDSIQAGVALSEEQFQVLNSMMEKSTNPSEFLSETILQGFNPEEEVVDDCNLDYLSLGVIPNNFKALA